MSEKEVEAFKAAVAATKPPKVYEDVLLEVSDDIVRLQNQRRVVKLESAKFLHEVRVCATMNPFDANKKPSSTDGARFDWLLMRTEKAVRPGEANTRPSHAEGE
jgi:hypothetical protein